MLGVVSERTPLRWGQLGSSEQGAISMPSNENEKSILLTWLNLLGWQVDVERDGGSLVGVARHCAGDGTTFRVGACAPTRDDLAFQLFDAAMKIVEGRGQRLRHTLLAA
jgi:hypothetical protein